MRTLLVTLIFIGLNFSLSSQEKRVALVIGNSTYLTGASLANPENDAIDFSKKLEAVGFDVTCLTNLGQADLKRAIDLFGKKLERAEAGLFFYAGHGVQSKGRNYLIPVDADLKTENDVEYNCVDAGRILAKMEDAGTKTNIVILDACRNNPFERSWSRSSGGNGLAFMNAPGGSLIAYSTAPGKTASDGYYRNSPYTSGLLEYIETPNLKIEDLFKLVRIKVMEATVGGQEPWESTSLRGDFCFIADPDRDQARIDAILPDSRDTHADSQNYQSHRQTLAAGIRSIAVMPLSNYTGDESKEYIVNGVHTALISKLEQLGPIKVISKTSTLPFADFKLSLKEIASKLNVEGIVEGSLIGVEDKLSLYLKLYSVLPEEELLWSEEYESDMSNILNLYNIVTKNIAEKIELTLSPQKNKELGEKVMINGEAYDDYLKGYYYLDDFGGESLIKARSYLQAAIEKDSTWAPLYIGLAAVWNTMVNMGFESVEHGLSETYSNLSKAKELDPELPDIHFMTAILATSLEWNWAKSENEFLKTLAINPNHALARMQYALLLYALQRSGEAMAQAQVAFELDPLNPLIQSLYAIALASGGDCRSALDVLEELLASDPDHYMANMIIVGASYQCGDFERVFAGDKKILPIDSITMMKIDKIYRDRGFVAAYNEINTQLEIYAKDNYVVPTDMAWRYYIVNQDDKAIEWLEKAYEQHDGNLLFITSKYANLRRLYDKPGFIEILKKMNLPVPGGN